MRVVVVVGLVLALCSCPASKPLARAHQIENRAQLIGGPRALGEIGDWMIENGKVRFIIQDAGFSRGFGVFGGALLDADLVRESTGRGNSEGGTGKDNFGEMFPAFFLEALEPREVRDPNDPSKTLPAIEIANDGSDGAAAVLVIRGNGGDFIALTQRVNELLLGDSRQTPNLFFETRYILEPDAQFLKMTTRVVNVKFPLEAIDLPNTTLGDSVVPTPFGDVVLFGGGNKVFAPHPAGFDVRFTLEDLYADGSIVLPALPGITAEFIASAGKDVSYGLLAEAPKSPTTNFVKANEDQFPGATDHSIHIPFIASAFTGVFQVLPPPQLTPNDGAPGGTDEMTFSRFFMVGDGDVASITDTVYSILGDEVGSISGRVRMDGEGTGMVGASIIVVGADGAKVTQMKTDEGGRFSATLRPGEYTLHTVVEGYATEVSDKLTIKAGADTRAELTMPQPAQLVVTVVEGGEGGGRVPAKVSLVGLVPADHLGERPRDWLFDLSVGEEFRYTDLVDDVAGDPDTLQYIEHFQYTVDGTMTMKVRPGKYKVVAGRGPEYDRVEEEISLESGTTKALTMTINRVLDTTGYVGADFHLHSVFSLDSNAGLKERIASYAGEGVEYAVSTDHNFIVDYRATIEKLGLQRFINSAIGLELTTIDRGHFNGFPLDRSNGALIVDDEDTVADTIKSRTYGSFEWALRDPDDIFNDLRALGRKAPGTDTALPIVLQVNHPRDSILGYFDQYGVSAETLEPLGQGGAIIGPQTATHPEFGADRFSFNFDAIEVFNGKRFEFLQTFRVPPGVTRDPVSCCALTPGDVVRDLQAPECDADVPSEQCNCAVANCQGAIDGAACDARQVAQIAADRCNPVGRDVAFPGVVDDWMRLLSTGREIVGTANSDSHEAEKEEPGSPRSWIRVPSDSPSQVTPDDVVAAFDAGDLLMSNGPFVRVDVGGVGMGGTVKGANISLNIDVQQAPWVKADTIRVFRNGEVVKTVELTGNQKVTVEIPFTTDGFLIVEVLSTKQSSSLFPSIYPNEIAPVQFTDVIGSLGSSLGLGSVEGALEPELIFVTTPYALTNPIWVDFDSDGDVTPTFGIPGIDDANGDARTFRNTPTPTAGAPIMVTVPTEKEANDAATRAAWDALPIKRKLALQRLPQWLWPSNDPRDIRRVLVQFVRHAH
ncbi:MAG: carboxypeptidase regulatory-like domain-containing protein [Deltaproteobacteria bacterium]|nr:carboxypeptidase regulatory-like domain-containing protein [Deltaproteobacteria bacterium]